MKYKTNEILRITASELFTMMGKGSIVDRDSDLSHLSDEDIKKLITNGHLVPIKSKAKKEEKS